MIPFKYVAHYYYYHSKRQHDPNWLVYTAILNHCNIFMISLTYIVLYKKTTKFKFRNSYLQGPLSGLRQFLTIESPLKMMKNTFYFMLKVLFVLEISTFLSWIFGYVEKRLDKKVMVNFKIYDVTNWTTYNHNTHSTNFSRSKGN